MSLWTKIRDTVESAAVLVGNYYIPGSSILTSRLTSKGSQEQLSSDIGIIAQLGTAIYGSYLGNSLSNAAGRAGADFGFSAAADPMSEAAQWQTGKYADGSAFGAPASPSGTAAGAGEVAGEVAAPPSPVPTNPVPAVVDPVKDVAAKTGWEKIGSFINNNAGVSMMALSAGMQGVGAASAAKDAEAQRAEMRADRERQLANINVKLNIPLKRNTSKPSLLNNGMATPTRKPGLIMA